MFKYQITAERKPDSEAWIIHHLSKIVDGFTLVNATGCYKGQREDSIIITIVSDEFLMTKLMSFIRLYCAKFVQECVLIEAANHETSSIWFTDGTDKYHTNWIEPY